MADTLDITIVMPCLNEAETLAVCIQKAQAGIARAGSPDAIAACRSGAGGGAGFIGLHGC